MADLFSNLLEALYYNCRQNGNIQRSVINILDNFGPYIYLTLSLRFCQLGVPLLQIFKERIDFTTEVVHVLPTSSTRSAGLAVANDAYICAETAASPDILPKR